jgi:hypothetical protein
VSCSAVRAVPLRSLTWRWRRYGCYALIAVKASELFPPGCNGDICDAMVVIGTTGSESDIDRMITFLCRDMYTYKSLVQPAGVNALVKSLGPLLRAHESHERAKANFAKICKLVGCCGSNDACMTDELAEEMVSIVKIAGWGEVGDTIETLVKSTSHYSSVHFAVAVTDGMLKADFRGESAEAAPGLLTSVTSCSHPSS